MTTLQAAQADFDKKDKRFKVALGVLVGYTVLLLTFLAVQTFITQSTIAQNQKVNAQASADRFAKYTEDNAKQHQKTQAYIRCIAQVLLLPIEQRTDSAFDDCSTSGNYNGNSAGSTGSNEPAKQSSAVKSSTVQTTPAVVQPMTPQPITQPTTTSAPPPDPEQVPVLAIQGLPILGGLQLGGILKVTN